MKGGRIACGLVTLVVWGLLGVGAVLAGEEILYDYGGYRFHDADWELACDNTRACRAVGYKAEVPGISFKDNLDSPISLRITRMAGPDTPVAMTVLANVRDKGQRLKIGTVDLRGLKPEDSGYIEFTPDQAHAVMAEMLKPEVSEALVWFGDDDSGDPDGILSLAGLNAVLQKMDEWQGRVGTPGALVEHGGKPESSVLPPVPIPVVKVAASVATRPADAGLAERIFPLLVDLLEDGEETPCVYPEQKEFNAENLRVHRLTDRRVLLSVACSGRLGWRTYTVNWVANDSPPYAPLELDIEGDFDAQSMSITPSGMIQPAGGGCWTEEDWRFDGQKFVLAYAAGNNYPCRDFGAWVLPTYVTRIIPPNSTLPPTP